MGRSNVEYVVAGWEETRRLVRATGGLVIELFEAFEADPEAAFEEMEEVRSMADIAGEVAVCVREMLELLRWPEVYIATVIDCLGHVNTHITEGVTAHEEIDGIPPLTRTKWNFIRAGHMADLAERVCAVGAASAKSEVEFSNMASRLLDPLVKTAQTLADQNDISTERIIELNKKYEGNAGWKM